MKCTSGFKDAQCVLMGITNWTYCLRKLYMATFLRKPVMLILQSNKLSEMTFLH